MLAEAELRQECDYTQLQCFTLVGGIKSYVYFVAIVKTLCPSNTKAYNLKNPINFNKWLFVQLISFLTSCPLQTLAQLVFWVTCIMHYIAKRKVIKHKYNS